ncbi:hypothetical protein BK659_06035 [Pseudomonas brassicacearum]|uniref:Uncharacterized protein n=1 Tax=Pseudomonas brassicacearum TaxID=930166 RepID=A0A423HAQ9_9PSED|nr:hypothetical protein [Pseudomonas brassicacearum]RON10298.1 hypothetical protein BK659_06035 [Pseudomonas brassicacearum]
MNTSAYEFTAAQRRVLDRYTHFLGSLHPTFNGIPVVFERRRRSGHQLAVLAKDSRLSNAQFNERYLQEFWERTEEAWRLYKDYVEDLETFTRESLEITGKTSRNEPVGQVDFRLYSLSRSTIWKLFPPKNVPDLIHELALRFYELRTVVRQLKYTMVETYNESFGLKSVFTSAMDHRSCHCHSTPTVVQELFRESDTTPVWDINYSSRDASVRAAEYKADIAALFNGFVSVNSQMGLFIEELYLRIDGAFYELLRAKNVSRLGELNFKLGATMEGANEGMAMMSHLEAWLRK